MPKKKKTTGLPPGTWIEREMFESKAYWALNGSAPQLLTLFLGKRSRERVADKKGVKSHQWTNLDSITMTYAELKNKYDITQPRATRAIDELLAKGFLEIRHYGGTYKKDKSIYSLIDKWKFWSKDTVFSKRERDVHRGYQGQNKKKTPGKVVKFPPTDRPKLRG